MAAQGLHSGSRWHLGNDVRINICEDHWTSIRLHRSPLSGSLEKVNDLIDGDTRQWKTSLIRATFLLHEVATILAIPLALASTTDRLLWKHTKSGEFSVRPA